MRDDSGWSTLRWSQLLGFSKRFIAFNLGKRHNGLINHFDFDPVYIRLKITENCNLRCGSCNHWKEDSGRGPSLEEIETLASEAADIPIKSVGLTGGEPALRDDLVDIVSIFEEEGFNVGMTTSGTNLDKSRIDSLVSAGLNSLNVSLDGPPELHNELRGRRIFDPVFENLKDFEELADDNDFKLKSGTLLSSKTLNSLVETINLKWDAGIPTTVIPIDATLYFNEGDGLWVEDFDRLEEVMDEVISIKKSKPKSITNPLYSLRYIKEYFRSPRMEKYPCTNGYLAVNVDSDLEVYPCWAMESVGNLRDDGLRDILGSEKHVETKRRMFLKKCQGCSCGNIPRLASHDFSNALSLLKNRAYYNQF